MKTTALALSVSIVTLTVLADPPAGAQQITGTPGSPGATTTIDGKQLPPPDPKFGGVIKEKASESQACGHRASCRRRARPTCCSS
jgi:hypothetical protein